MSKLVYLKGDATEPILERAVIAHVCNDMGGWGRGFVLALSKKWKEPETYYRNWSSNNSFLEDLPFKLGRVQFVPIKHPKAIVVANMIGQHGINYVNGIPPVRYEAMRECLKSVYAYCEKNVMTLHAPKFGAGLAGGDWNIIEQIIKEEMKVDTYIYLYEEKK